MTAPSKYRSQKWIGQAAGGLELEERLLQFSANGAAECLAKTGLQALRQAAQRAEGVAFVVRVDRAERRDDRLCGGAQALP